MFERLSQSINAHISLTEEQFNFCKTLFLPKKLRKRQYLLQEGDICKYVSFVEKGMLRTYTIGEKGNEYILSFPMDGWWTADLYSFFTGEPSLYNIEALENCELLLLTKSSWNMLLEKMPALERYFRIIIQNNLIAMQRRLLGSMSETAQEKYTKLVATFPDCIQRVPQHMIASYLGISRETLSRIRRQIAVQK